MINQTPAIDPGSLATTSAIDARGLQFAWPGQATAIAFPDIQLSRGDHLFLHGPSGTGKSTLLSLFAGMLTPTAGSVRLLDQEFSSLRAGNRDRFRADHIGVIFQQFNLVPYLTALGNVTLPCRLSVARHGRTHPAPDTAAHWLLDQLGISTSERHRGVTRLSIGQQQRVAAARALIGTPEIILADEPTSALDADNRDRFLNLLLFLAGQQQSSVVFVSHDPSLARHFHQQMFLGAPA